jgi:hypothetical protein
MICRFIAHFSTLFFTTNFCAKKSETTAISSALDFFAKSVVRTEQLGSAQRHFPSLYSTDSASWKILEDRTAFGSHPSSSKLVHQFDAATVEERPVACDRHQHRPTAVIRSDTPMIPSSLEMMFPPARVLCVPFQADAIRGARLK